MVVVVPPPTFDFPLVPLILPPLPCSSEGIERASSLFLGIHVLLSEVKNVLYGEVEFVNFR